MKKRKLKLWKPVVAGFSALYLMIMGLSTWLVEDKFEKEFKENANWQLSSISRQLENGEDLEKENFYDYLSSQSMYYQTSGPFQLFSMACYQTDGQLLAHSENALGYSVFDETGSRYIYHTLEDLSKEEKELLAAYGKYSVDFGNSSKVPPKYRIFIREQKESQKLCQILVQEIAWKTADSKDSIDYTDPILDSIYSYEAVNGTTYDETDSEIIWERNYPEKEEKTWKEDQVQTVQVQLLFPYLLLGDYDQWQQWNNSKFLQNFDSQIDISMEEVDQSFTEFTDDSHHISTEEILYTPVWSDSSEDPVCYLALRIENHPWTAAIDYMKSVYLLGLVLMLICIAKIIFVSNKISRQRDALEEMRRDFTNAMAHELKTPLSIIRGFAENLLENTIEDKRDYYLTQIIGQTENMDQLVAEMIAISKIDSNQLILQKESVSVAKLIQEQIKRLEPMIQEKNLQIQYNCSVPFIIEGDQNYLEKAIWNLLSNAIAYNIPNGRIQIRTDSKSCTIENTGDRLNQEQLDHAFDLFYSGDKSHSSNGGHMGIGLFLTKKILELHHLKISLENISDGVRVTIE